MAGSVKIYALIIIGLFMLYISLNLNKSIIMNSDVFDCVRQTQISTLEDNLNIGDIIVNQTFSMDTKDIKKNYRENFEYNSDLNLNYQIKIVDVNSEPAAIAVSVKSYSDKLMSDQKLINQYENVVIIEGVKDE